MRLNAEESEEFIRALFFPSLEETIRRKRILDEIDQCIIIIENNDGFTAYCKDLDLSFLNN